MSTTRASWQIVHSNHQAWIPYRWQHLSFVAMSALKDDPLSDFSIRWAVVREKVIRCWEQRLRTGFDLNRHSNETWGRLWTWHTSTSQKWTTRNLHPYIPKNLSRDPSTDSDILLLQFRTTKKQRKTPQVHPFITQTHHLLDCTYRYLKAAVESGGVGGGEEDSADQHRAEQGTECEILRIKGVFASPTKRREVVRAGEAEAEPGD